MGTGFFSWKLWSKKIALAFLVPLSLLCIKSLAFPGVRIPAISSQHSPLSSSPVNLLPCFSAPSLKKSFELSLLSLSSLYTVAGSAASLHSGLDIIAPDVRNIAAPASVPSPTISTPLPSLNSHAFPCRRRIFRSPRLPLMLTPTRRRSREAAWIRSSWATSVSPSTRRFSFWSGEDRRAFS